MFGILCLFSFRELEQIYDDERKIKKDIMNKHDK